MDRHFTVPDFLRHQRHTELRSLDALRLYGRYHSSAIGSADNSSGQGGWGLVGRGYAHNGHRDLAAAGDRLRRIPARRRSDEPITERLAYVEELPRSYADARSVSMTTHANLTRLAMFGTSRLRA